MGKEIAGLAWILFGYLGVGLGSYFMGRAHGLREANKLFLQIVQARINRANELRDQASPKHGPGSGCKCTACENW